MALRSRGMPPCQLCIYINGKRIAQVPVTQHCRLRVTFNDTLSWKDHVHKVVLQSARKIGLLRRLCHHLSPHRVSCVVLVSLSLLYPPRHRVQQSRLEWPIIV